MIVDGRGWLRWRADEGEGGGGVDRAERLDAGDRGPRIRCPKCDWTPHREDLWQCGCGHAWNTFETRARCPVCAKQWRMTQCSCCEALSRHDDWYDEPGAR